MHRTKKVLKDIVLFAIASFGPKLLSFFLLPIYTAKLSTTAYGTIDLYNTIISVSLPILVLDISDAVLINTIEMKGTKKQYAPLKYSNRILLLGTVFFLLMVAILSFWMDSTYKHYYCVYLVVYFFCNGYWYNLMSYLRGANEVLILTTSSLIGSLVTILANVVLIVYCDLGVLGLMAATCSGSFFQCLYSSMRIDAKRIYSSAYYFGKADEKSMLKYSVPLIFTGIAWWINSSSDRLFISYFTGVDENGIYAAASKIPGLLTACSGIISQALQLSVFREINAEDAEIYLKRLYEIYSFIVLLACSVLIFITEPLARILFSGDFFIAWKYSPGLLISTALFSIVGYLTTIIAAEKKTGAIAKGTVIGAIINSVLNFLLIPGYKIYGAVCATIASYFVIWLIIFAESKKMTQIDFYLFRTVIGILLLIVQWICTVVWNGYCVSAGVVLILIFINMHQVKDIWGISKNLWNSIREGISHG